MKEESPDTDLIAQLEAVEAQRNEFKAELEQRNRELDLLHRVSQAATLDLSQVASLLLQEITEIVGAEAASVWLLDEQRAGWLVCRAFFQSGQGGSLIDLSLEPGQGIAGWVVQTSISVIVPDVQHEPRFFPGIDETIGFTTRSLLAVPLQLPGRVIGVMEVVNKLPDTPDQDVGLFTAVNLALAESLATSVAAVLDNARLVERLRLQTAALRNRNQELDAFAHTVAHDLSTPLSHIVGYAHLLEEGLEELSHAELREHVHTVGKLGRKMINITEELLLLSNVRQIERVELAPLRMEAVVSEARARLAYMIEEYSAEIVGPRDWPVVLGHAGWVEEVWINYISNALRYGGRPPRVEVGAIEQDDGMVRFWVQDNGDGVSGQDQTRLFTPFTQLRQARVQGHGLGLSIVGRIIRRLGGEVGVESQGLPGKGSTFFFTLRASP